jgi:hypothetical protein
MDMNGLAANTLERLIERGMLQSQAFIGGNWVEAIGHVPVLYPATGDIIATVAVCDRSMEFFLPRTRRFASRAQ